MESAQTWRVVAAVAAVVTVGCGAFAVAAAVTSDDDAGTATETEECAADATQQVRIAEFEFQPPELSVAVGIVRHVDQRGRHHPYRARHR